jgi:Chs5-Arf1p-binding protein BUD7/BCH1
VFVMEEEYRMQKAATDVHHVRGASGDADADADGESTLAPGRASAHADGNDDDASTRGVVSPAVSTADQEVEDMQSEIPTIRISSESDRTKRVEQEQEKGKAAEALAVEVNGSAVNGAGGLEKPVQAAAGEDGDEDGQKSPNPAGGHEAFSFSNKRLCERWLDNLFMVLYEVGLCSFPFSPRSLKETMRGG